MPRIQLRHKALLLVIGIVLAIVLGEALVWLVSPSEYMYPRYQFSREYGLLPFPDVVMVHGIPRRFEFRYTTNRYSARGEAIDPGREAVPTVLVLGDSNAFGMGVPDGEDFPAVMREVVGRRARVVSLASPGWGLTQEIRRYYELGAQYYPETVVLQFCSNDPEDNLANRVAIVENGEFRFIDSANSLNWIKKYLSRSFVQRTQLYNFLRTRASRAVLGRMVAREAARLDHPAAGGRAPDGPPAAERVYNELLVAFAEKLHADGRRLVVIAVDRQLEQFPFIQATVRDLESRERLWFVDVLPFLAGMQNYSSPEGHVWGAPAHRAIGEGLARLLITSSSTPAGP